MSEQHLNSVSLSISAQGIAEVSINNPDKHNAFDDRIIELLTKCFQAVSDDPSVRAVILKSQGKSFSAGADLSWMKRMAEYNLEQNLADANKLALMLNTLYRIPVPTIARVQGAAFGGAVGLSACCDIVIASERAKFCLSEVKLGLIPATISPYVIEAMGAKRCRRLFTTAEVFDAQAANQFGLVDVVCEHEQLDDHVNNMLNTIINNGPQAVRLAKQLVFDVQDQTINSELMSKTSEWIATTRVSEEAQQGLHAFFNKQLPPWQTAVTDASKTK